MRNLTGNAGMWYRIRVHDRQKKSKCLNTIVSKNLAHNNELSLSNSNSTSN